MSVCIIDYGSGNLRSAAKALERSALEMGRAPSIAVTDDPDLVRRADHVVLPGVGAYADCLAGVSGIVGMMEALVERVIRGGRPFLGICVGMQLMASRGLEHGVHAGFDWIKGEVGRIRPTGPEMKVPHMGWNELAIGVPDHPVLAGIEPGSHCYFVHSYGMSVADPAHVLATVDYGGTINAAIGRDNLVGTQFHPEKSQAIGLKLLSNFLSWRP